MAAHPTWHAATCIAVVALIIHIVGVATPVWVTTFDMELGEETSGLWQTCSPEVGGGCEDLPSGSVDAWFAATRAMAVIGMLALTGTVACGGFISAKPQNIALTWSTFAFVGIAVASTAIALFVFGTMSGASSEQLGYSFHLCITSAILSAISSVLFAVGRYHTIHASYIRLN